MITRDNQAMADSSKFRVLGLTACEADHLMATAERIALGSEGADARIGGSDDGQGLHHVTWDGTFATSHRVKPVAAVLVAS